MRLKHVDQGSPEWHKLRATGIGSSDFSVIASHYGLCDNIHNKSIKALIKEKLEPKIENNDAYTKKIFQEGHEQEENMRQMINFVMGMVDYPPFAPAVSISSRASHLIASMDCFNETQKGITIIEMKNISPFRKNFNGLFGYFMAQMAHQYFISLEISNVNMYLSVRYPNGRTDLFQMFEKEDHFILYDYKKNPVAALELTEELWLNLCDEFWNQKIKPELPKNLNPIIDFNLPINI